jgi:hypothetical protein
LIELINRAFNGVFIGLNRESIELKSCCMFLQTFSEGLKFAITGHTVFMATITALATFFCAQVD